MARTEWLQRTAGIAPDAASRVLVGLFYGNVLGPGDRVVAVDGNHERLRAVLAGAGHAHLGAGRLSSWQTPGLDLLTDSLEHGLRAAAGAARRSALAQPQSLTFCYVDEPLRLLQTNGLGLSAVAREGGDQLVLLVPRPADPAQRLRCLPQHLLGKLRQGGFAPRLLSQRSFDQLLTALADARRRRASAPLAIVVD